MSETAVVISILLTTTLWMLAVLYFINPPLAIPVILLGGYILGKQFNGWMVKRDEETVKRNGQRDS
jgi:uncharacterized protein (DUF2062 family)